MSTLDLARLQFASTTIYHFLFVPVTIGLSMLVAGLHTAWYRTGTLHGVFILQCGRLVAIAFD